MLSDVLHAACTQEPSDLPMQSPSAQPIMHLGTQAQMLQGLSYPRRERLFGDLGCE